MTRVDFVHILRQVKHWKILGHKIIWKVMKIFVQNVLMMALGRP